MSEFRAPSRLVEGIALGEVTGQKNGTGFEAFGSSSVKFERILNCHCPQPAKDDNANPPGSPQIAQHLFPEWRIRGAWESHWKISNSADNEPWVLDIHKKFMRARLKKFDKLIIRAPIYQ
jgi:hypothetical protein